MVGALSGGGNHEELLKYFGGACFEKQRCQDAKRHGLLRFELFKKIYKFLSLNFRNILISPLEGEKKFFGELNKLSNKGRLGILAQREAGFEPSPAFVMLTGVRKRLLPLTKREGCDSVISNNFPDTVFSRFTSHFSRKCTAFTLAEVLITLGIIGIVAAITLPTIINNYRVKVLENQFRKADSLLQQAFRKSVNELGYTDVSEFTIPGSPTHQYFTQEKWAQLQVEAQELNKIWLSQFKIIKTVTGDEKARKGIKCYNFFGNVLPGHWGCFQTAYMLADGMSIRPVSAQYGGINQPGQITFEFDTNGPYKGPNRMGYDIFVYYSYDGYTKLCNPNIINSENYTGCYYWAHRNMSPIDNSKPYWDVLYKPLSYWNK